MDMRLVIFLVLPLATYQIESSKELASQYSEDTNQKNREAQKRLTQAASFGIRLEPGPEAKREGEFLAGEYWFVSYEENYVPTDVSCEIKAFAAIYKTDKNVQKCAERCLEQKDCVGAKFKFDAKTNTYPYCWSCLLCTQLQNAVRGWKPEFLLVYIEKSIHSPFNHSDK